MKKIATIILLTASFGICQAQIAVPKVDKQTSGTAALKDFIKPPAIGDVGGATNGIVDMLTSKLALPGSQKPQLTDAITGFLTNKKSILGLADSNPTSYLAKFNPLQQGLFGKLKGVMGAASFTKFLGLKPAGSNIAGNALSNLFF